MQFENMKKQELIDYIRNRELEFWENNTAGYDGLWEMTFNSIPDMISIQDTEFNIIRVNRAYAETVGMNPTDIKGLKCYEIIHGTECPYCECPVAEVLKKKEAVVKEYYEARWERYIEVSASPIFDDRGIFSGVVHVMRDITDEKQAETEIGSLAKFPDENPNPTLRISFQGEVLYVNSSGRILLDDLGCREGMQIIGEWALRVNEVFESEKPTHFEVESDWRKFLLAFVPITEEGYINVYGTDITEQKNTERKIRENEERFRVLFNTGNDLILVHLMDELHVPGKIVEVNEVAVDVLGYSREELLEMTPFDLRDPLDSSNPGKTSEHLKKTGKTVFERILRSKDGRSIPFEINFSEFEYQGQRLGLAVARDVMERKKTETALRESEENYRMLFENANDLIQSVDLNGRIQYVNRKWLETLGYTEEDVNGISIFDVIHELSTDHCRKLFRELSRGKPIGTLETVFLTKDGRQIVVEGSSSLKMKDGKVSGTVGIFRDVTQKRKIEQELQKAQKLESIGVLAGGIAHDFNNLLMGITGNVSLAKMYANGNEDLAEILDLIAESGKKAERLTNQLLTFSKGGTPVRKNATVTGFLKESAEFLLSGSNVNCEYNFNDNLWTVEIDKDQINQVLHNLIKNSKEAMPEGGTITISAENRIIGLESPTRLEAGDYVCISVKDEGPGIPDEIMARVFDPFFSTKKMGAGMGLSTSFSIITQHDGCLEVVGDNHDGAEFRIYLPARRTRVDRTTTFRMNRKCFMGRILIMDDEEVVRFVTGRMLQEMGYEVDCAEEGKTALSKYREAKDAGNPYDAVIMDLTIPGGMGGKETITKMIEYDPDAKVIVSSGYSNDPVIAAFKEHGFSACVPKPYEIEELGKTVDKLLRIN